MQVGAVEFGEARDTEQGKRSPDLVLDQFEHPDDRGFAAGRQRVALHAPERDQVGAGGDRLD